MTEKVYFVSDDNYLYTCGPNEQGMYACCHVHSLDCGRLLWPGAMHVFPAKVFERYEELEPCESARVLVAIDRKYPTH